MRSHELIATAMVDGYYSKLNHGTMLKKKKKKKKQKSQWNSFHSKNPNVLYSL